MVEVVGKSVGAGTNNFFLFICREQLNIALVNVNFLIFYISLNFNHILVEVRGVAVRPRVPISPCLDIPAL